MNWYIFISIIVGFALILFIQIYLARRCALNQLAGGAPAPHAARYALQPMGCAVAAASGRLLVKAPGREAGGWGLAALLPDVVELATLIARTRLLE